MSYYFGKDIESALFPKRDRFGAEQDKTPGGLDQAQTATTQDGEDTGCEENCRQKLEQCEGSFGANCREEFQRCKEACNGITNCQTGWHWDDNTGACVPDVMPGECDPPCIAPQVCKNGVCVDPEINEPCAGGYRLADQPVTGGGTVWTDEIIKPEHGWSRNPDAEGHYIYHPTYGFQNMFDVHEFIQTQKELTPNTGGACRKGYVSTVVNGETMCCPGDKPEPETPGLGEFQFPAGMQEFYDLLMGRGKELLNRPLGITPEEEAAMFGKNFENITNRGDALREQDRSALSRVGGLGTGMELEGQRKISRGIEEEISDAMRDLLIYGSERKKSDILDYTGTAQGLFGSGLQYENLMEAINSSRRGEGQQALMNMLTLLFSGAFN